MDGHEFLRRLRRIAHRRGCEVRFVGKRGKGSHGTVHLGDTHTVMPDLRRELKSGMVHGILKQLGVTRAEWTEH